MKAIVKSVVFARTFNGNNGTGYSWNVVMDNGDAGETATSKNEAPWKEGEEAEYTKESREYQGNTYWKLKKVNPQGGNRNGAGGGRQWTPDPEKETRKERGARQLLIIRESALSSAAKLAQPGTPVEKVLEAAAAMEAWIKRGIDLKAIYSGKPPETAAQPQQPAAPAPAAPTPAPAAEARPGSVATSPLGEDDLPF